MAEVIVLEGEACACRSQRGDPYWPGRAAARNRCDLPPAARRAALIPSPRCGFFSRNREKVRVRGSGGSARSDMQIPTAPQPGNGCRPIDAARFVAAHLGRGRSVPVISALRRFTPGATVGVCRCPSPRRSPH
jgi:hypothetical protein